MINARHGTLMHSVDTHGQSVQHVAATDKLTTLLTDTWLGNHRHEHANEQKYTWMKRSQHYSTAVLLYKQTWSQRFQSYGMVVGRYHIVPPWYRGVRNWRIFLKLNVENCTLAGWKWFHSVPVVRVLNTCCNKMYEGLFVHPFCAISCNYLGDKWWGHRRS